MGGSRGLRSGDARARAVSDRSERRLTPRQVVTSVAINHRLFEPSPSRALAGPAPLVVALHGCTQTAGDFAAGTRFDSVAERVGAYVAYPEQAVRENPHRCWNWFLDANQTRDSGEPAAIVALVDELLGRYPIDPDKVFVAGMSAGGAMAAILAEQAPDRFAAAGIMAGVPLHACADVDSAYAAMRGSAAASPPAVRPRSDAGGYARLRVTIWTGADDRLVAPANAAVLAGQFLDLLGMTSAAPALDERGDADVMRWRDARGTVRVETWRVAGMGHAWSGGSFRGSHTHPKGPRASEEMMAFFLETAAAAAP